jgi:hypothetical protein
MDGWMDGWSDRWMDRLMWASTAVSTRQKRTQPVIVFSQFPDRHWLTSSTLAHTQRKQNADSVTKLLMGRIESDELRNLKERKDAKT